MQFARPDQAVQQSSPLTTMVRSEEQEVFTTQTNHPQGIFSDIIVCFGLAIVCIVCQYRPLVQGVREYLRQLRVPRQSFHLFTQPDFQCIQQRFRFHLTFSKVLFQQKDVVRRSVIHKPIFYQAYSATTKIKRPMLPTVRKWVFRNLGGDFHARGLITRRLSSSNPARPYICRFSIFRRFTWPSTTPLLQLLVMASHIAAASVSIPAATR